MKMVKCPVCGHEADIVCNECGYNVENEYLYNHTVIKLSQSEIDNHNKQINIHKAIYRKSVESTVLESNDLCDMGYYQFNQVNDVHKAFDYYSKAARLNNPVAYSWMGYFYDYGQGVSQDYSIARDYYNRAIEQNEPSAMKLLADMYREGRGVVIDLKKSLNYYQRASRLNNNDASVWIGYFYENGMGVDIDYIKAREYYELAIEQGNARAAYLLGYMYYSGRGVNKDINKAKDLFLISANREDESSYEVLGYLYFNEDNYEESFKYYHKAADVGNVVALAWLGYYYENSSSTKFCFIFSYTISIYK